MEDGTDRIAVRVVTSLLDDERTVEAVRPADPADRHVPVLARSVGDLQHDPPVVPRAGWPARGCGGPARCAPGDRSPCRHPRERRAGAGRRRRRARSTRPRPHPGRRRAAARSRREALPSALGLGRRHQASEAPIPAALISFATGSLGCAPLASHSLTLVSSSSISRRVGLRVVAPDDLDETTVARRARVGYDDTVDRVLLRSDPRQSHTNSHSSPSCVSCWTGIVPIIGAACRRSAPEAGSASCPCRTVSSSSASACGPRGAC